MHRNTLYGSLLRSVYALDGLDGDFLGDLAATIRVDTRDWRHRAGHPVTLAVIPANQLRRLRRAVATAEGEIDSHRSRFARLVREGKVADLPDEWYAGGTSTARAYEHLVYLLDNLAEAKADLAAEAQPGALA